jgi:hypothetical protein
VREGKRVAHARRVLGQHLLTRVQTTVRLLREQRLTNRQIRDQMQTLRWGFALTEREKRQVRALTQGKDPERELRNMLRKRIVRGPE